MKNTGKAFIYKVLFVVFLGLMFPAESAAITLFTPKEALSKVFEDAEETVVETKTLTDDQMKELKKILGGQLANYEKGSEAAEIIKQRKFDFYFGVKDGTKTGIVIMLEEPGKWGPITFLIHLRMDGVVQRVMVLRYTETRGRPIARRSFLNQFVGLSPKQGGAFAEGIVTISGATISSEATIFTVRKAVALYELLYAQE